MMDFHCCMFRRSNVSQGQARKGSLRDSPKGPEMVYKLLLTYPVDSSQKYLSWGRMFHPSVHIWDPVPLRTFERGAG